MKPICLVTAPVATRSGYGAHSRDICRALIKLDKYDVRIWPVRWGSTPMNALHVDDPNDKVFIERINGELKLKLIPPITVKIDPPPDDNDQIIWEGKNYLPKNIKDGIYTFNQDSNNPALTEHDLPD